jgi:hypothetical protein
MRHVRLCTLLLGLSAAACQTGPVNGTTAAGGVVGKSFLFQGYWNQPSELISLQVMTDPTLDPNGASWVQFATATSSTTPTTINSTDPLYYWSVTAAPVPNAFVAARWPQGGLVRVRAFHDDANGGHVLTTFDDVTFGPCLSDQLSVGADWTTIGIKCAGLGDTTAALVSTSNIPVASGGFLGLKGDATATQTTNYYVTAGLPLTLPSFKAQFGFPAGEVTATFFNDGDLGLGREMHCKAIGGGGVACYVTNYDGSADPDPAHHPVFTNPTTTILADAVARTHGFATVAMIYTGGTGNNSVKFIAYGANGAFLTNAKLDSTAAHTSIPNNCLACHGINASFNPSTLAVTGAAKFLPFDPFSYKYSTAAGFTQADQADAFRRLNALVRSANPTTGIAELIDGMYAPKAVTDPTAVASDDFVPDAWANVNGSLAGTALYRGVVKVGCRTCHISATNTAIDFNTYTDFFNALPSIRPFVCGAAHTMPHAERVMKKFWESGARAYLVTGFPPAAYPDALQACKP